MTGIVTLQFNGFPDGYCYPGDPDVFAGDIINYTSVVFNTTGTYSYYNYGPNEPTPEDRIYPWYMTEAGVMNGWYIWDTTLALWVRPHPTPASGNERRIWVGTPTELETYDGGDANVLGDASGPMWAVDSAFAAKFPVGVGTFAASGTIDVTDSTTSTAVTGEDQHTLTVAEMPEHSHTAALTGGPTLGEDGGTCGVDEGTCDRDVMTVKHAFTVTVDDTGGDDPHNNLPPMYGVYFIKRTVRIYYRAV